jgi:hypothetical protein
VSDSIVDREEIEIMMWNLADTLTYVRDLHDLFLGDDDEEEEGDT